MGSIMCLGVSVSNSVMLVTFIDEHWKRGVNAVEASILGASERLRPILMTACAMTVGMVPMALALEKGSQMQAPLGLAVIGGLVMSTFATLLVVPSIFAVVVGNKVARSPSIYPDDPASAYYDPRCYAREGEASQEVAPPAPEPVAELPAGPRHDGAEAGSNALVLQRICSIPPRDGHPPALDEKAVPAAAPDAPSPEPPPAGPVE
jgi:hypothetical protein